MTVKKLIFTTYVIIFAIIGVGAYYDAQFLTHSLIAQYKPVFILPYNTFAYLPMHVNMVNAIVEHQSTRSFISLTVWGVALYDYIYNSGIFLSEITKLSPWVLYPFVWVYYFVGISLTILEKIFTIIIIEVWTGFAITNIIIYENLSCVNLSKITTNITNFSLSDLLDWLHKKLKDFWEGIPFVLKIYSKVTGFCTRNIKQPAVDFVFPILKSVLYVLWFNILDYCQLIYHTVYFYGMIIYLRRRKKARLQNTWDEYFTGSTISYVINWGQKYLIYALRPDIFSSMFVLLGRKMKYYFKYFFLEKFFQFWSSTIQTYFKKFISWQPIFKKTSYIGINKFFSNKLNRR